MKSFIKMFGVIILNFLPMLSCLVFSAGFIAWIMAIMLAAFPLFVNYKCFSKPIFLLLADLLVVASTPLAIFVITHLYVNIITNPTEFGTNFIGSIFMLASLVLTFAASMVMFIVKCVRRRKGTNT